VSLVHATAGHAFSISDSGWLSARSQAFFRLQGIAADLPQKQALAWRWAMSVCGRIPNRYADLLYLYFGVLPAVVRGLGSSPHYDVR
jgi:hypothetical protein